MIEAANPNDNVYTPAWVAKYIIGWSGLYGIVLDPCRGMGAFYDNLPDNTQNNWCEISEGKNFYEWKNNVDWVIGNPPYSDFDGFMKHAMNISDNIVFLVPVAKILKSWRFIKMIFDYGGIVKMWLIPAHRCGFPFGFPACAFHLKKGYCGATDITRWNENEQPRLI